MFGSHYDRTAVGDWMLMVLFFSIRQSKTSENEKVSFCFQIHLERYPRNGVQEEANNENGVDGNHQVDHCARRCLPLFTAKIDIALAHVSSRVELWSSR